MPLGRWEYDRSKRPIYLARCESARRPNAEIPHHSPLPRPGHIHGLGTTHQPATKVQTAKSLSRYVAPSMSLTRWDRSETHSPTSPSEISPQRPVSPLEHPIDPAHPAGR